MEEKMNLSGIFRDFLFYCEEDNEQLSKDIKTWLADYFDLANRTKMITTEEVAWIEDNLSEELQLEIFDILLWDWIWIKIAESEKDT